MKNILTEKWISGGTWLMINCLVGVRGTIQGNSRQGNILGVCFTPSSTPHPSFFTPPSSAPAEQRQLLFVGNAFCLTPECVFSLTPLAGTPLRYLQRRRWWLRGDWPWGYRSGPVPAGPSVQRFSTFFSHFHWRLHTQSSCLQQNFVFFFL